LKKTCRADTSETMDRTFARQTVRSLGAPDAMRRGAGELYSPMYPKQPG